MPFPLHPGLDRCHELGAQRIEPPIIGPLATVRADFVEATCLFADRTNGTGVHALSLADPLLLFYVFATQTRSLTFNETPSARATDHDTRDRKNPKTEAPRNRNKAQDSQYREDQQGS